MQETWTSFGFLFEDIWNQLQECIRFQSTLQPKIHNPKPHTERTSTTSRPQQDNNKIYMHVYIISRIKEWVNIMGGSLQKSMRGYNICHNIVKPLYWKVANSMLKDHWSFLNNILTTNSSDLLLLQRHFFMKVIDI